MLGLSSIESPARTILHDLGVKTGDIEKAFEASRGDRRITNPEEEGASSTLDKYSVDLTARARDGKLDPVIGRDHEIRRVIQVLARRTKNNPVLIGEPGVGKTAVVEGLAQRVIAGTSPTPCVDGASCRWTWRPWWPGRSTAESSRNGSRPS